MNDQQKFLQYGKYSQPCPQWLSDKVKVIECATIDEEYVKSVLRIIAAEFDPSQHKTTTTHNIRESRLITVNDILNKRLSSCGAKATVVASVFRGLGIPTKLIHGRYVERNPNLRHAWNEMLLGDGKWHAFDIDGKRRGISEHHQRETEVTDWEEIEDMIDEI
jgi:transglutaminase/protease-like cytokinesis protein 3